jgi:hypothetical protein
VFFKKQDDVTTQHIIPFLMYFTILKWHTKKNYSFRLCQFVSRVRRIELSQELILSERQIKIWFQERSLHIILI